MNWSDSERIATVLEDAGYSPVLNINEANLIVINMCSVRQSAVDRVYGIIQKIQKLKTNLYPKGLRRNVGAYGASTPKAILSGCILKKDLEKFKNHFDYILSIKTLKLWPEFLKKEKYFYYPNPRSPEFNEKSRIDYLKTKSKNLNNFSAFVPISTGCNNFCTYCVVPYTRGPEFSRQAENILNEVKTLIEQGCKEIWLLGENVNSYKSEIRNPKSETNSKFKIQNSKQTNFSNLLRMINNIPGNFWIRFTSSHPKDFSDELIETMAKCKKVTPYLNLPVQSGDDEILKKMNRPYTAKHYKNLVKKIRNAFKKYRKGLEKNIFLSTDVIVGFPGETKKQLKNTAKLFKEIKFDMAYISQYSLRPVRESERISYSKNINFSNGASPETTAAKMEDTISRQEKARREKVLTEILKETALENGKKFKEKEIEVLIEKNKNNFLIGKSRHYKTVKIEILEPNIQNPASSIQHPASNLIGKFVEVKIIDAAPFGLKGKLIE